MKSLFRIRSSGIGLLIALLVVLTTLCTQPKLAHAASRVAHNGGNGTHILEQGPATLIADTSQALHLPINPPQAVQFIKQTASNVIGTPQASGSLISLPTCLTPTLDLKVLVIGTDGNEPDLPAIQQALDYLGTPYTVYLATRTPNGLTPGLLANGCHGYYQGIILTNGALVYYNGSGYVSALSQQEWTTLWAYQAQMNARLVSWYTTPSADYGYQPVTGLMDSSVTPLNATPTSAGQSTFSYLTRSAAIPIQYAFIYLANALTDGTATPILTDSSGHALGLIHTTSDGRQTLSLTFDSNPYLIHSIVFSYGLINWVTRGLFLGARQMYMSPQVDDLFIDDSDWTSSTPCGTPVDNTGASYRIDSSDFQNTIAWQNSQRAQPVAQNLTLTMAFNGAGTVPGTYTPDTLTPAVKTNQAQFYWVNHTFNHTNLDSVDYATATSEITQNNQLATSMGFTRYNRANMVTPDISGLTNPNFLQAAYDNGVRYLVSDTSQPGYNNPSPNAGIYNTLQPQILMIPRIPNNLFYNVSTPDGWVAEYNCIYHTFWGRDLSYSEILAQESQNLLTYMLKGELDPWMFHQPNLRAYDGSHSLLGDLLSQTLQKYEQYYNLPIVSPTMDQLGLTLAQRMQYNVAGVTASLTGLAGLTSLTLTMTAQKAAVVPVTGLTTLGGTTYGGQHVSYVHLAAGQSMTFLLP